MDSSWDLCGMRTAKFGNDSKMRDSWIVPEAVSKTMRRRIYHSLAGLWPRSAQ